MAFFFQHALMPQFIAPFHAMSDVHEPPSKRSKLETVEVKMKELEDSIRENKEKIKNIEVEIEKLPANDRTIDYLYSEKIELQKQITAIYTKKIELRRHTGSQQSEWANPNLHE